MTHSKFFHPNRKEHCCHICALMYACQEFILPSFSYHNVTDIFFGIHFEVSDINVSMSRFSFNTLSIYCLRENIKASVIK